MGEARHRSAIRRTTRTPRRYHNAYETRGAEAMKGHVRKRGSTWSYIFAIQEEGKRKQIQRGGFRLRKDAEKALSDALSAYGKGDRRATAQPSTEALGSYL